MLKTISRSILWLICVSFCRNVISTPITSNDDAADEQSCAREQYAAKMLSFMDESVHPCDDFYEYACGNWKNVIKPRSSQTKRSYLTDIDYELTDIAELILDRANVVDIAPEYEEEFQLAKQLYWNCLETDLVTKRKSFEYLEVIQMIGGFPALDADWDSSAFSWVNMSAHMSKYGIHGLMKEGVVTEYPFRPYYDLPTLGFDIELHADSIQDSSSNAYQMNYKQMYEILSLYEVDEDKIGDIVERVFDFLKDVFLIFEEFDENEFVCKNITNTLAEDQVEAINNTVTEQWRSYLEISWLDKDLVVDEEYKPCDYLYYKLDTICEEHKEAVANYLSMKFIYDMGAQLKDAVFQSDYCTERIRIFMTFLIDHLYMKIYNHSEALEEVNAMIDDMKTSLRTIIEEADWLDEETREEAFLKETAMGKFIGRYEDVAMIERLMAELKNLQFIEGNYEANNLNLKKFDQYMNRYNSLHIDELDNSTKPLQLLVGMQANAFYYNNDNSMYVMAGVLNPPIYHKSWPDSLKYGTLGFLIGHEFTHAFDTVGAKYDSNGTKHYWWSEESDQLFKERAQCFVDYYDSYHVPEINRNINGNATRDENIADAGGLRVGLLAYRRLMERKGSENNEIQLNEEQLPGLDLTPEQLFFLGSAQVWCSAYEEAHYWAELSDVHTIDKYRVLGMLSNNADFARAYNCPMGSAMNPSEEKCQIW